MLNSVSHLMAMIVITVYTKFKISLTYCTTETVLVREHVIYRTVRGVTSRSDNDPEV